MPRRRKDILENSRVNKEKPQQRNAANARERARMRILSRAFSRLKTTLPWVPADTKLSKLDTLRLATSYIAHLRTLLCEDANSLKSTPTPHPISLTWPFSFNKGSDTRENTNQPSNHCELYGQFSQHPTAYPHSVVHNHPHNHHHHHHHSLSQHNNQTIDRYYGEDLSEYDYYTPDIFQM